MAGTDTAQNPRVLVLKTGTTYPRIQKQFGDFEDWFIRGLSGQLDINVADATLAPPPGRPEDWHGVVITGSPAMVSDRSVWSEQAAEWVRQAVTDEIPLLGVCYGHQLLAHALGGQVDYHPGGRETGTQEIRLCHAARTDPLFGLLPDTFPAQLTHKQSVLELPPGAVLLASSEFEPHQAFRVGRQAWGVQFHPEFTEQVMQAYLEVQYPDLEAEGLDAESLLAAVRPAPDATRLLRLFSDQVIGALSA